MPRFTSKDGKTVIETSNPREIVNLRRDGFKETVARTKAVREEDTDSPANVAPAIKAPKSEDKPAAKASGDKK